MSCTTFQNDIMVVKNGYEFKFRFYLETPKSRFDILFRKTRLQTVGISMLKAVKNTRFDLLSMFWQVSASKYHPLELKNFISLPMKAYFKLVKHIVIFIIF